MVLVGSSFGSSGIFWCFVRVWLSVILYSAGCSLARPETLAGYAVGGAVTRFTSYDPGLPQTARRRFFKFGGAVWKLASSKTLANTQAPQPSS